MSYVTLPIKILITVLMLFSFSCKTRMDGAKLSSDLTSRSCVGPKDRLDCPFQWGLTHSTGGECTQRFVSRLFSDRYLAKNKQERRGFNLWEKEKYGKILHGEALKQYTIRMEIGRFREAYSPEDGKWYTAMKPFFIQTRQSKAEPVVFEWKLETMGAPNNSRILKTLIELGYFDSGEAKDDSNFLDPRFSNGSRQPVPDSQFFSVFGSVFDADGMGPGVEWNNYRERNERAYRDPHDFFLSSKFSLRVNKEELQRKIDGIKGRKDYAFRLKTILTDFQYSNVDSHPCKSSVWAVDQNFRNMIEKEAEKNSQFIATSNPSNMLRVVFQELGIRNFFRSFHFDFSNDVPFIGSEHDRSPFLSTAENSFWSVQMPSQSYDHRYADNIPNDFYFGDLVLLNNSSPNQTAGSLITTNPTQLSIVPFLAKAHPEEQADNRGLQFRRSNEIWTFGKNLKRSEITDETPRVRHQPTVLGRFVNRGQAYIKMKRFLDESKRLAIERGSKYTSLRVKTNFLIQEYINALDSGRNEQLAQKEQKLSQTTDAAKVLALNNDIAQLKQQVSLDIESIRKIAEATRIGYWHYEAAQDNSQTDPEEDSFFSNFHSAGNQDIMIDVRKIRSADSSKTLLQAFIQAIKSKRPKNARPIEDLRIMSIKLVPEKDLVVNEQNLLVPIPGTNSTFSPAKQRVFRGIE